MNLNDADFFKIYIQQIKALKLKRNRVGPRYFYIEFLLWEKGGDLALETIRLDENYVTPDRLHSCFVGKITYTWGDKFSLGKYRLVLWLHGTYVCMYVCRGWLFRFKRISRVDSFTALSRNLYSPLSRVREEWWIIHRGWLNAESRMKMIRSIGEINCIKFKTIVQE